MSALNEDARQRLLPETEKHDEEGETRIQFAYDSFDWGPQSHAKRGKKEQTKGNQHLPLVPRGTNCIDRACSTIGQSLVSLVSSRGLVYYCILYARRRYLAIGMHESNASNIREHSSTVGAITAS